MVHFASVLALVFVAAAEDTCPGIEPMQAEVDATSLQKLRDALQMRIESMRSSEPLDNSALSSALADMCYLSTLVQGSKPDIDACVEAYYQRDQTSPKAAGYLAYALLKSGVAQMTEEAGKLAHNAASLVTETTDMSLVIYITRLQALANDKMVGQ